MAPKDRFAGYEIYGPNDEKIGKIDDLFVDENDQPEYVGVKMGFLGLSGTALIPWEICRADDANERIEVDADQDTVKNAPTYADDEDITPDLERRVHEHYGLTFAEGAEERGAYQGERSEEDELRIQRTEEELRTGTREREAGGVNVRKRVRTDRESVTVPKRHEEVHVDRVPVDEAEGERVAAESEIGDDEVNVPVVEDEVVTEKKPVAKEEVRVRKEVVADEEIVEEDVRKEEIDIDDDSKR